MCRLLEAVLDAVKVQWPDFETVTVEPLDGYDNPENLTHEIPDSLLPKDFQKLKWTCQVCHCVDAIITWATHKGESAAILVLAPGESEMEQIFAQWVAFDSVFKENCNLHRVHSETPKDERYNIRTLLHDQNFRASEKHNVVISTAVFEKSITLWINGVIDTSMAVEFDAHSFVQVVRCDQAKNKQRKGRGGRVK